MKHFKFILFFALSITLFSCASTQNLAQNDGSTIEKAVKVDSIKDEYKFAREKCGDCTLESQALTFRDDKTPIDVLTFKKANGETVYYYFDISNFFGKHR